MVKLKFYHANDFGTNISKNENRKIKRIIMKAYESGFYAGQDASDKAVRDDYNYMRYRRRKYIIKQGL